MNGMATDPTDGQTSVIMKVAAVTGSVLGRINLIFFRSAHLLTWRFLEYL